MIKRFIVSICLLFSAVLFAQKNSASPYSYYGIGDVTFKGTVENRSMAGLGIIPDSVHINLQNPASYSSLVFTALTIGGSTSSTTLKTSAGEDDASRTTLDYLAVGVPVSDKFGVAVGLVPYSAVGYKVESVVVENGFEKFRRFEGDGGLNRVFAGVGYDVNSKLSIGADVQYNFGNIETKSITGLPEISLQYPTRELNAADYRGFSFNLGATYQTKINEKYDWYTSATYTPQANLSSTIDRNIAIITFTNSGSEIIVDEIDITGEDGDVKLPSKFSIGTGFGKKTRWFVGTEYTFQESNELGNRFDNVTNVEYETSHKMALGGYFTPQYRSYNSYFKRMTYRAGLRYEKTGLVINGESINDYAVSLGFGFPVNYLSSNINLGIEYGQRGTTSSGLVQENYLNFSVGLSLNDRWFVKRRYN